MNTVRFVEPNFRCRVARANRPDLKPVGRLVYAESEQAAREFFQSHGYVVHSIQAYDFALWKENAKRATTLAYAAHKRGQKPVFKSAIWAVLKEHLQDLFSWKCAYCEAWFMHVAFGDVEHYRPKAKVEEDPGHPGYYWLAYDPNNYLPSCQLCNQGIAKKNHFPVSGTRAYEPADSLEDEHPDLVNPYRDAPLRHLRFAPSTSNINPGWVMSVDDRGQKSIEHYDLNREFLITVRKREQEYVRLQFKKLLSDEDGPGLAKLVSECRRGRQQFSAAAIAEIEDYCSRVNIRSPFQ